MALQLGSSHSSWVLLPAALLLLLLTASPSGGGAEAGAAHRDGGPRPPYELLVRPARRPSDDPASRRGEAGLLLLLRPPSTPASGDVPQGNASEVLGGRSPSGGGRRSPPGPASCRGEAGLRPSSGGPRWAGRRPAEGGEEYLLQEEEEEQQEEVPAPAGPATSILEGRLHRSSIRHRKSRRNFVRTRKSPKAPPRSRSRGGDGAPARGFEASSWELLLQEERESDDRNVAKEEEEEDGFTGAATPTSFPWSSSGAPNLENKFRATGDLVPTGEANARQGEEEEEEEGGGGGEEEEEEEEEEGASSSADPRRHEGAEADVDVVTKFLRIVESQHLMGENCTKGTDFNLGEGVVDRYAQERFRLEGEIAVNRANLYTRLWKYSAAQVLASEYLLHAEVLTMVELDEDIFAAGNCYDKYEYEDYLLFCPFAYRLPEGTILVKDLAVEYKYLSNTSEWFFIARKNAERAIKNHTHLTKGYHTYKWNSTAHTARVQEEILSVTYEDGRWSKPYFDCGGGNIWMMTYTVPFFGYANGSYYFKGTSGIDIDLRRVDIDQCPLPPGSTALNIFANSHKCKKRTTKCVTIPGLGFRRGSYRCECRVGFYFPNTEASDKYYNGSVIEEEYEKKIVGEFSTYDERGSFECLPCAEGCETCLDASPCVVSLNWVMRTAILTLSIIIILSLPVIVVFTWKYGNIKVVRAASPALLRIIILGAFFIYSTTLVLYPIPTMVTCSLRVWLREIGFSLAYGALMLKTWRISVIFRVRSAKAVKITDLDLTKRLGVIVGVFAVFLAIRTVVAPPQVIVSMTADDLKAFLCSTDWWDHAFTAMEMVFLVWGIRLCIMVRKAPSEFNESRFISMAIYNEFLLSLFLNVSMLFLQSPANPDLLFIIFFCHTQLTITLLIALIFGSKAYLVVKGQGKGEESMSMTKPMAAKFLQRPQAANSHNLVHSSSSDHADMQEEFRRLYMQLESLRERNLRLGNRQMVAKITAMKEAANNLPTSRSPATAAPPLTAVVVTERCLGSTAEQQQQQQQLQQQQQQQLQQRRPSRRDRKYSDGIVMKPYVNNILANMTDKIVCATFQEELQAPPPSVGVPQEARGKAPSLRNSVSNEENLGRKGGGGGVGEKGAEDAALLRKSDSKGESFDRGKGEVGVPERAGFGKPFEGTEEGGPSARAGEDPPRLPKASPPGDYVGCNSSDASGNSKLCRSSSSRNNSSSSSSRSSTITSSSSSSRRRRRSDDAASGRAPKDLRPPGHRSAEFLLRRSASTEVSERFCRSLERLDEGAPGCGGPSGGGPRGLGEPDGDQGAEDRSVRSAHSTPRRSRGRRFREVRDPERARAFILHSLSGRAELTDEVTV